jgi:creatinine amidohydrolase
LARCPVGYLPLGTLEWHGEHAALGTDALISGGIFERAAHAFGGIVFPPLFLGPDVARREPDGRQLQGMDFFMSPEPEQFDGSCYWIPEGLFLLLCENILNQAARAGFRVIVADGHGPSRAAWGENVDRWEARYGLTLISVRRDLPGWQLQNDHAARNETSSMLALRPDLVDLAQIVADRSVRLRGVAGEDPRDSTAAYGEECLQASLELLLAKLRTLSW